MVERRGGGVRELPHFEDQLCWNASNSHRMQVNWLQDGVDGGRPSGQRSTVVHRSAFVCGGGGKSSGVGPAVE